MTFLKGWFVDWDGKVRTVECPGDGYRAILNNEGFLEVLSREGVVAFTATYYSDFDVLENVLNDAGTYVKWA